MDIHCNMLYTLFLVFLLIHPGCTVNHQQTALKDMARIQKNPSISNQSSPELANTGDIQKGTSLSHQAPYRDTQKISKEPANENNSIGSTMYSFSAELSSYVALTGGSTLIFDRVITNVGGLYFPNSGYFICPDDGLYVFIWSIMKATNTAEGMQCISKLSQGGNDLKFGPKASYFSTTLSGATEVTYISKCTTSPPTAVTIINVPWSETELFSEFYLGRTSFSGYKLQSAIAFTVELSEDSYLIDRSRIMFDNVLSNFGGFYDITNGRFLCPDDGVYGFSFSAYTVDPATPWSVSRIMKERSVVVQGPITYRATEDYKSGSSSINVVLQCTTDHSIYVEIQVSHDFICNSYGAALTSFLGYKLFDVTPEAVAFTAVMANNHTTIYDGQPLIFDSVITNIGDVFDPMHGTFQCPDNDYYLFSWRVTANYGSGNFDLFMKDTRIKMTHLTYQTSDDATGTSGTASVSVIRQCATGSRFQVRARYIHERVVLGNYTMFTGYKIPGVW